MSEKMYPIPFASLMNWATAEYARTGGLFGVHKAYRAAGKSLPIFGERIETPFGPAAGPNSQLAQNIIAAYFAGARYFPDPLGVLKPGAAADIIVMDYKPFTPFSDANVDGHMIFGMTGRQCQTTIANGRLLMKDRELLGVDEEAVNARILEASKKLWGELNHETY